MKGAICIGGLDKGLMIGKNDRENNSCPLAGAPS